MTFSLRTDRRLARARASSTRYVLVSYTAPRAPVRTERIPVSIALVLDRSGSMAGERKFPLAREAAERALGMLRPEDRFALVVYDDRIDVLAESTLATATAKRHALDALRAIEPRGSTDLCAGWLRGCEQLAEHLGEGGIARALLLTDGLANQGVQDRETLSMHARELRQRGIATSTFGVGADFDERLLRDMAHEGSGNFYFIESPAQIPDLLTSELGEAMEVVVKRAAIEVSLPPGADAEPLNRFRFARAHGANALRIELGDLVSGQELRTVIKVRLSHGEVGVKEQVHVSLVGEGEATTIHEGDISWMYADHADNDRQPRDRDVDREVATLYAARARAEATEANRSGNWHHARRVLERTAERIESYAGEDPVLRRLARELREQVPEFAERPMGAMGLKAALFASEATVKARAADGRARRHP